MVVSLYSTIGMNAGEVLALPERVLSLVEMGRVIGVQERIGQWACSDRLLEILEFWSSIYAKAGFTNSNEAAIEVLTSLVRLTYAKEKGRSGTQDLLEFVADLRRIADEPGHPSRRYIFVVNEAE